MLKMMQSPDDISMNFLDLTSQRWHFFQRLLFISPFYKTVQGKIQENLWLSNIFSMNYNIFNIFITINK